MEAWLRYYNEDRPQAPDHVAELRRRPQPTAVSKAGKSNFRRPNEWSRITLAGQTMVWNLFRGLRQVFTGRVVKKIDTTIGGGGVTISLRLKEGRDGDLYVVFVRNAGNYLSYDPMELAEFETLFSAMQEIRIAATRSPELAIRSNRP